MLNVSDEVRAEIGDDEADRLLDGAHAPDAYDCTACREPGDSLSEQTSTVLFVGEETAVLAFAHARCIPSQVVPVAEAQLQGAVRSISQPQEASAGAGRLGLDQISAPTPATEPFGSQPFNAEPFNAEPFGIQPFSAEAFDSPAGDHQPAVLGITCGLVLCEGGTRAALVVEPTGPVGRPGSSGGQDQFLPLLGEQGFQAVADLSRPPAPLTTGWSILLAMGQLHAILQPSANGGSTAWWQAHQPLLVTDPWRAAASRSSNVIMYAAPAGTVGRQPREDLLRIALDRAAAQGLLLGAVLPLAGT